MPAEAQREAFDDLLEAQNQEGRHVTTTTPERLFKYVGFSPRALQQLCLGEVYYADPSKFNDPLDCQPIIQADLPTHELKDVLAHLIVRRVSKEVSATMTGLRFRAETIAARQELLGHKVFDTLVQNIQYQANHPDVTDAEAHTRFALANAIEYELRKAYDQGVLCLSSRFNSPLMWSHYADQHRGICIEFDVSKLPPGSVRPVQYGDSRELPASAIQSWLRNDDTQARQEIERACLFTKSTEWRYEDEYRLLGRVGVQFSAVPFKSITFGMRCEGALEYVVIAALRRADSDLNFFRIPSPGARFELSREEVNVEEALAGMPRINILDDFEAIEASPDSIVSRGATTD
jgi:hypothetical protein